MDVAMRPVSEIRPTTTPRVKKVNPQNMIHLTEKPVELAERAMTYSSQPGENVLDLFGGSGSTLIAAEKTGRRAFLMEVDPLKRLEKIEGGVRAKTPPPPLPPDPERDAFIAEKLAALAPIFEESAERLLFEGVVLVGFPEDQLPEYFGESDRMRAAKGWPPLTEAQKNAPRLTLSCSAGIGGA